VNLENQSIIMKQSEVRAIRDKIRDEQDVELLTLIAQAINHDSVAKWRQSKGLYKNPNKSIATENWNKAIASAGKKEGVTA
jgi:hypothetical protein